jgi:hypothetical protein
MNDMSPVIVAKSDQMNADDLMGSPRTIRITKVDITAGNEQPVNVYFEGDDGKPWRPCKSMSRVMVALWGPDAKQYAGKSLTLFRDPKVKWGGLEVGGIRISHASHIDGDTVVIVNSSKGKKAAYKVAPLKAPVAKLVQQPAPAPEPDLDAPIGAPSDIPGDLADFADALELEIEHVTDGKAFGAKFNAMMRDDPLWKALRNDHGEAGQRRAADLKAKATAKIRGA